jgi:hypothetical protein
MTVWNAFAPYQEQGGVEVFDQTNQDQQHSCLASQSHLRFC